MYSRAEQYRRNGIAASHRAAQATEVSIKLAFDEVARKWFALAKQAEWLERNEARQR
jgi:hypothetical protein